jgi:hypothetical protein
MKTYRITDTRQVSEMGVDGRFHDSYEVTYMTDSGHVGSIRIRKDQATPEAVETRIDSEVAGIDAIRNIT